jgi:hypothetical protein
VGVDVADFVGLGVLFQVLLKEKRNEVSISEIKRLQLGPHHADSRDRPSRYHKSAQNFKPDGVQPNDD